MSLLTLHALIKATGKIENIQKLTIVTLTS